MAGKFKKGDIVRSLKDRPSCAAKVMTGNEVVVTADALHSTGEFMYEWQEFYITGIVSYPYCGYECDFELVYTASSIAPSAPVTSPKFKIGDRVVALKDDPNLLFLLKGTLVEVVSSVGNFPLAPGEFYYRVLGSSTVRGVGREDDFGHLYSTHAIQFVAPAATSPTVAQYFGDGTAPQLEEVQNNVEKCECGSSLVGSPYHSTWCPLFKP